MAFIVSFTNVLLCLPMVLLSSDQSDLEQV